MKRFALLFAALLSLSQIPLQAQKDQDPDTLRWNNRRYAVTVLRDVPSLLSVYYLRTALEPPFQFWSSSNNRGHVATYEILNNELCLVNIEAKRFRTQSKNIWAATGIDTVVTPDYFHIKPLSAEQPFGEGPVCVDWFSGVVELSLIPADRKEQKSDEARGRRLLYVDKGRIQQNLFVTDKEYKLLATQDRDQISDTQLREKKALLNLQHRFTSFYARCAMDREEVSFYGHKGLFEHKPNSLTLFMELFGNDPLRLPQSTLVNDSVLGAPFGNWSIRNDSLFLESLSLHWGSQPFSFSSRQAELFRLMAPRLPFPDGTFFADWIDGDYVIHYGQWETNAFGVPNYTVAKTQKLRIRKGVVTSSSFSPSSFQDDENQREAADFVVCDEANIYSVNDKQLAEVVGTFKSPKKNPAFKSDKSGLRTYFLGHPLTDQRAKERLFRVRIAFLVNCKGRAGNWQIINSPRGELFEFSNMVLDIVRNMPQNWQPATDKKGNPVDCWQILEFTVSEGSLTNADYK